MGTSTKLLLAGLLVLAACGDPSTQPDCHPQQDRSATVESRQIYFVGASGIRAVMTTGGESIKVDDEDLFAKLKPGTEFHIECEPRGRYSLTLARPDA